MLFLIFVTCLLSYCITGSYGKQSFQAEPKDVIVNPNENVILPCKVNNREGLCNWLKDNKIVGKITGKYIFDQVPESGDCSLQILNTNLDADDAEWQCQVTVARIDDKTLSSHVAKLTVREEPMKPFLEDKTISIQDQFMVSAGETRTIHCISRKGNPPAIIKWFIDDVDVTEKSTQTNSSDLERKKTFQATSVLTYTFNKEHNKRTLKCSALHEMYPEKSYPVAVTLDVMYPPSLTLVNKPEGDIIENMRIGVRCVADANPEANVIWMKAGNSGILEFGEYLTFDSISREQSGIYSCSAKNNVGDSQPLELSLDVKYPPRIKSLNPSQSIEAAVGSKVNFTCLAEGNPPPEYHWIQKWDSKPPRFMERSKRSSMLIKNITYDHQGKFVCKVRNRISTKDEWDQSQEISIDVHGPPQILASSERTKRKIVIEEEQNAILMVFFCSDPPPRNTYWEWGSLKLNTGTPRGRFKAERLLKDHVYSDCFEARLNIDKTTSSDARKYIFNVMNGEGKDTFAVALEIKKPVAVSMVIGIVLGCIFILVVVIILLIYAFKAEKLCFKRSGTHDFKTDHDSEMGAGNTDTARTTASGAIPPDAVYSAPTMASSSNNNSQSENGLYENVRADKNERKNNESLVYADLDLKPLDRSGQGSGRKHRGSGSRQRPEREPIEYAEIQFQPKVTEQADL